MWVRGHGTAQGQVSNEVRGGEMFIVERDWVQEDRELGSKIRMDVADQISG